MKKNSANKVEKSNKKRYVENDHDKMDIKFNDIEMMMMRIEFELEKNSIHNRIEIKAKKEYRNMFVWNFFQNEFQMHNRSEWTKKVKLYAWMMKKKVSTIWMETKHWFPFPWQKKMKKRNETKKVEAIIMSQPTTTLSQWSRIFFQLFFSSFYSILEFVWFFT